MSDAVKYVNRTADILAYQVDPSDGMQEAVQSLTGDGQHSGKITTGVQKLAQRFLLELLTERGSMPYNPERGCGFLTDARRGVFQSQLDVFTSFSSALVDIRRNLRLEELASDPEDEKYASAEITQVIFSPGFAAVYVKISSVAGSTRTVIAPLDTVI